MKSKKRLKIEAARDLRKKQTKAEERMWWLLRDREMQGYKFRRQYICKGFIMDFYCPAGRLGIELDGKVHMKQKDYDKLRQNVIEEDRIKLLRFKNSEVFNKPDKVLQTIIDNLSSGPLLEEERGDPPKPEGRRRVGEVVAKERKIT